MSKLTVCLVVMFMVLNIGYATSQNVIKIRVAEFAPNYFKNDAGNWTGLSVELAESIVKAAGFEPNFLDLPWSRSMKYLKNGDLHYMTNLYITPDRSKFLYWVGPVRTDRMGLIVHRDHLLLPITSLDDLVTVCKEQKKQFGFQQDISYSDEFDKRIKNDPEFQSCFSVVADVGQNMRKTLHKRILGFLEIVSGMKYQFGIDQKWADLTIHSFVLGTEEVFHGVSKKGVLPDTLKKLQDGYTQCLKDGTIQRILKKWNMQ
ncbi:MAG: amino acid ABC transporter substrate-binding protein [Desulfobacteraceae bacterium]|nr:amino acid ABC transporter substrate-binding protein [Desulfobacteraceae bacterium]